MLNRETITHESDSGEYKSIRRPKIVFFDYPDIYEDFYPHYGISQLKFASWNNTANHAWLEIIQKDIGDVTWIIASLKPQLVNTIHETIGCKIKFVYSSWLHRILWKIFYLPSFAWRWKGYYRSFATVASYLAPLSYSLIKSVYNEKADVIFVQDYCSGKFDTLLFLSWLFNIPLITYHSGSTPNKYLGKGIRKHTIRKAKWIFSSGSNESQSLLSNFKVNRKSINIIRPPINIQVYKILDKENACFKLGLNRFRKYLLFIGRFEDAVKRISSIIGVFHKLAKDYSKVDLLIVGAGKDEHSLKNLSMELVPGRVFFPGWIESDAEKALYYNVSECLILASTREASPAVIGEAFSCGIPVITSNVGGVDDLVIPEKSGWLFPPENDHALREYLEYVLANPEQIRNMRKGIRKIAEEKVSVPVVRNALKEGFSAVLNSLN